MHTTLSTVMIAVGIVWGLFLLLILRAKREENRKSEERVRSSWGAARPRPLTDAELQQIRQFSDHCVSGTAENGPAAPSENASDLPNEASGIDDITANDLDLDQIFARIGKPFSSAGEEVLYAWLRHPLCADEVLRKRADLIRFYETREEDRLRTAKVLDQLARVKGNSFYGHLQSLKHAEPIGTARFVIASLATLACIVGLFFAPLPAVLALIAMLFVDYRLHIGMKEKTAACLMGFHTMLRLAEASKKLAQISGDELKEEKRELAEILDRFQGVRRGAFWLTSAGAVGTGLGDAVLEYVKLFFHPDLIAFDRMLRLTKEHGEDALRMLTICGSVDAAICAASFRKSLPYYIEPVFIKQNLQFTAEDLYHPLLANPVPNTIDTAKPVLFTGSNASGKSTFLKACALAAVTAQSLMTVCAKSYSAPYLRVCTSMALTDSISRGESYFMAEIRSIRRIFDSACEVLDDVPVFALIDEVLRGTNTVERIAASSQVLKAMADHGGILPFAATHDIELTCLLEDQFANMHFEEQVEEEDVRFDYILKNGRARSRNAIRLLKMIGYDRSLTDRAEEMAERFDEEGVWKLL